MLKITCTYIHFYRQEYKKKTKKQAVLFTLKLYSALTIFQLYSCGGNQNITRKPLTYRNPSPRTGVKVANEVVIGTDCMGE